MQQLPTDWIALAGLTLLLASNAWQTWQGSRTQKRVDKVDKQVSNGHFETNLRDDIDGIKSMVTTQSRDIRGLREDIGGLRGELRDERQARGELERTVERIDRDRRSGG
ncbi:DUF2746 domain-containing protein [Mycobacterium malmoense]|uniref:DUF2746 domain-containing protein n=1 Tax=Mycobacterium malmoense TaxID=1780 RepID=UPI0008F86108|nr:DUF2746 domain-containing protein [Mycobacterium malmoense]OIN79785.1 hypothetical protein BMG05_16700 [Mycobacterium malmoense]